ncbi:MAG: RNA-binding protein [Aigarchaeota archaeon]|nr:RNA-binding protein [Aigarchaeota archaeon]MCX8192619.1 RNA-binding protein [Nitrososphaeria archaeon]MDW7985645.1 RNA-binding protein [Nitrososphaerota archaeon]
MRRAIVIVGKKPKMRYVTACITLFNRGEKEVLLRARGRSISNCIDVALLLKKSFYSTLRIKNISLGCDEAELDGDKKRYVSFIEILISLN